jgi:mannose-6-phosphate isomerase-like protein (cupin superfamily)
MTSIYNYIESGILEQYVLGNTNTQETKEVERMAVTYAEVKKELESISYRLEAYANKNALTAHLTIKPFILAIIDYSERLQRGEEVSYPPVLTEKSVIDNYSFWLNREDMVFDEADGIFAKLIGYTQEMVTAIVWLTEYAPHEVHHNEYERFLIVEGSCNIVVEGVVHSLYPGNYFQIPLHKKHVVEITSTIPCKIILQRVAA